MRTTALSIYFFWIGLGGFFPQLVTPLTILVGLRCAIIILFPGLHALQPDIFFTSMVCPKRRRLKVKQQPAIRLHSGQRCSVI